MKLLIAFMLVISPMISQAQPIQQNPNTVQVKVSNFLNKYTLLNQEAPFDYFNDNKRIVYTENAKLSFNRDTRKVNAVVLHNGGGYWSGYDNVVTITCDANFYETSTLCMKNRRIGKKEKIVCSTIETNYLATEAGGNVRYSFEDAYTCNRILHKMLASVSEKRPAVITLDRIKAKVVKIDLY